MTMLDKLAEVENWLAAEDLSTSRRRRAAGDGARAALEKLRNLEGDDSSALNRIALCARPEPWEYSGSIDVTAILKGADRLQEQVDSLRDCEFAEEYARWVKSGPLAIKQASEQIHSCFQAAWRSKVVKAFRSRDTLGRLLQRIGATNAVGTRIRAITDKGLILAEEFPSRRLQSRFDAYQRELKDVMETGVGVGVTDSVRDFLREASDGKATADMLLHEDVVAWLKSTGAWASVRVSLK